MGVAQAATSAACDHDALAIFHQVGQQFSCLGVAYNSAARNEQHHIFSLRTVHFLTHTCLAITGLKMMAVAIINQRIYIAGGFQVDAATASTIPAIGATKGREFLAAKVRRAVPPIARLHINFGMIVKRSHCLSLCPLALEIFSNSDVHYSILQLALLRGISACDSCAGIMVWPVLAFEARHRPMQGLTPAYGQGMLGLALPIAQHKWSINKVLRDEPQVHLVGTQYIRHEHIIGAVVFILIRDLNRLAYLTNKCSMRISGACQHGRNIFLSFGWAFDSGHLHHIEGHADRDATEHLDTLREQVYCLLDLLGMFVEQEVKLIEGRPGNLPVMLLVQVVECD